MALDLDPELHIAALALGDLHGGRPSGPGVAVYNRFRTDSTFGRQARLAVAECYRRQEKFDDAETLLRS